MNGFDFCQNLKNLKLGPFFQKLSLVTYDYLTSCEKLEKTDGQIHRSDGQMDE